MSEPKPVERSDIAKRALAEAEVRRAAAESAKVERQKEIGGRGGEDPVRYGDWEKDGIAHDF
jgi:hypothetical protein